MDRGQCSQSSDDEVWAKLVPNDPSYNVIEIRSQVLVIRSETKGSTSEKFRWCEISRSPEGGMPKIKNLSSNAIIVDGTVVKEEMDIKCGSKIISGPDTEEYLTYHFQVMSTQNCDVDDKKRLKISLDVEHAKCSICLNIWHDVVTVAPCMHNFCNGCFSEWLKRSSTRSHGVQKNVICPQCRATVYSVGRNHFLRTIEEVILQTFSSLKRSDEEIAELNTQASIKTNVVLGMQNKISRKRPSPSGQSSDLAHPCPQCAPAGSQLGGFRCRPDTTHLQCQGCGGFMPSRPDIGVPQQCLGCDRTFCGAYWISQGVDAQGIDRVCNQQIFRPISEHTISTIPNSTHQNNQFEKDVTDRCILQTGKTLQAVIRDWIIKLNNREIDRSRLQLSHAETINSRTHLCNDCYSKLVDFLLYWFRVSMPRSLLPSDVSGREDCWYGYACRTQHHNNDHARKKNHVCRPTRGAPPSR